MSLEYRNIDLATVQTNNQLLFSLNEKIDRIFSNPVHKDYSLFCRQLNFFKLYIMLCWFFTFILLKLPIFYIFKVIFIPSSFCIIYT